MKLIIWVFTSFIIFESSTQDLKIHDKCDFIRHRRAVICSSLEDDIDNVNNFLSNKTRALLIMNNNGISFSPYHHNHTAYKQIVSYMIADSSYLNIDEYAFYGMSMLKYLKIQGNFFPLIKNNSFRELSKLKVLLLDKNNITTLERNSFAGLKNLLDLDLSSNKVESIFSGLFTDLTHLQFLDLQYNKIRIIEENSFSSLSRLKRLDMRFNKLKVINAKDFNPLQQLGILYLSSNDIEIINGDLKLSALALLHIDHNQLKIIQDNCLKKSEKLQIIDLSDNKLFNITAKPFENLPKLIFLNLRNNYASMSEFSELKKHVHILI